jgi:hypothetical protein
LDKRGTVEAKVKPFDVHLSDGSVFLKFALGSAHESAKVEPQLDDQHACAKVKAAH